MHSSSNPQLLKTKKKTVHLILSSQICQGPMCSDGPRRSEELVKLAQRLRLYKPHHSSNGVEDSKVQDYVGPNRAAVLICLFEGQRGDLRVILTKRSSAMSSHSGEVALPGGRWEEGDENDADTALREANEEIGLDPSIVEVVTTLEPFYTKRKITVFPVIGIIWDINVFTPVPNAAEVESVFDAPLDMFLKNENRRDERAEWMGYNYLLHFFDYQAENESYVIWAFTAAVLIRAASVVYQRSPAFEVNMPKFWSRL